MAIHSSTLLPSSFGGAKHSKPKLLKSCSLPSNPPPLVSFPYRHCHRKALRISASVSVSNPEVRTGPDDLVASILSKKVRIRAAFMSNIAAGTITSIVAGILLKSKFYRLGHCIRSQTDRGVLLKNEEHKEVAAVAEELQKYCVNEPVKCRLIFGEWDVVYCSASVPTIPGGGYRSALGRLVFKTKEMIQVVEAPETVRNKVFFSSFGFLDGEVSLKEALEFRYGGQSEVKLQITYIDDKIRLGKDSRGSLFVFQRRN